MVGMRGFLRRSCKCCGMLTSSADVPKRDCEWPILFPEALPAAAASGACESGSPGMSWVRLLPLPLAVAAGFFSVGVVLVLGDFFSAMIALSWNVNSVAV